MNKIDKQEARDQAKEIIRQLKWYNYYNRYIGICTITYCLKLDKGNHSFLDFLDQEIRKRAEVQKDRWIGDVSNNHYNVIYIKNFKTKNMMGYLWDPYKPLGRVRWINKKLKEYCNE